LEEVLSRIIVVFKKPTASRHPISNVVAMDGLAFAVLHEPALETGEIRHGLLLSIVNRLRDARAPAGIKFWTLGGPGECAVQTLGYPIVLGDLSKEQCRTLAETMSGDDYPGVVGTGETALDFAERAEQLGVTFEAKEHQQIQALTDIPQVPSAAGTPRLASRPDLKLVRAWVTSFIREAIPSDPIPSDEQLLASIGARARWLWFYGNEPVAMAAIARRNRRTASINSVFTPREHRNQGFGAAITAYVARQIFLEGRGAACLYVDLSNAASVRCYAKLGFKPVCDSWLIIRRKNSL
jgi:ribosomal protein S18 acetylase RimI-like enzyme